MHLGKYNVAMTAEWYVPASVEGRTIITKNGGRGRRMSRAVHCLEWHFSRLFLSVRKNQLIIFSFANLKTNRRGFFRALTL